MGKIDVAQPRSLKGLKPAAPSGLEFENSETCRVSSTTPSEHRCTTITAEVARGGEMRRETVVESAPCVSKLLVTQPAGTV
jgi:hypothetical protein